jgi:RNA-directed DNA polymerase
MVAWQDIPWRQVHRHVFRLQKRMYQATQRGQVRTRHKVQQLLIKSWYARLLAVRRVTQDNRGKHTAGIDGVKVLTAPQRWCLATELRLDGTATALRRTWIPKRGSLEKRPLGIPTQGDRARQTLVRQAVEPEWEAKLAPHTYGFRPGRSCWDAIEAIFLRIRFRPQYALKGESHPAHGPDPNRPRRRPDQGHLSGRPVPTLGYPSREETGHHGCGPCDRRQCVSHALPPRAVSRAGGQLF